MRMRQRVRHTLAALVIMVTIVTGWGGLAWGQRAAPPGESSRLTLQQAIQIALEKHPVLQTAEFAVRGAEARFHQARAPYYPQVGGVAVQTNGSLRANAAWVSSTGERSLSASRRAAPAMVNVVKSGMAALPWSDAAR